MTPPPESEPFLSMRSISKRFGNTQALSDVSVSAWAGRTHALVGENGAGKSTLVKIMGGIMQPDAGTILHTGNPIVFDSPTTAASHGIHLVHQELALLPYRSIVENMFLGQELHGRLGLDWTGMGVQAATGLERLGLDLDVRQPVGALSTAHQQIVEIARSLVHRSRLIILDEPTAALSPGETERLFFVLDQLAKDGTAIVYISHRLNEVEHLADTVTVLKDGKRVTTEPAHTLSTDDMVGLMVGREIKDLFPPHPASSKGPPLLVVHNLSAPPAIKSADLSVQPGEIVGIYGLEGHGQDELLACIAGVRKPAEGTLHLDGRSHGWGSIPKMIRDGIGYVPADRKTEGLLLDMTGINNITLPILPHLSRAGVVSPTLEHQTAKDAAAEAGVSGELETPVSSLSGGNQQKLMLARWMAARSRVLLLNQPTRGVDIGSKAEIYSLIRQTCSDNGSAAIVVSREITELQGLCDRIAVMSQGRLVAEHSPTATEEVILASAVNDQTASP